MKMREWFVEGSWGKSGKNSGGIKPIIFGRTLNYSNENKVKD